MAFTPTFAATLKKTKNIAILASGAGSNADQLCHHFRLHPNIRVKLVITNKSDAGVIKVAQSHRIPFLVIPNHELENQLLSALEEHDINFVALAGFLRAVPKNVVKQYAGQMVNIHPALLPKFGGKGMYGRHVHEAVLAANEKESGITIHFVTDEYDAGDIIFQTKFPLEENETVESLARKVHRLEHQYYPAVIENLILNNNF